MTQNNNKTEVTAMKDDSFEKTFHTSTSSLDELKKAQKERLRNFAGVAGNVLEWYDFALFGFFADIISDVFFPPSDNGDDNFRPLVESFLVFGGAFLVRPLGGLVLGWIGDVYGRKRALEISIFLMAFPTFCMGVLPTYQQVGSTATVLLILVRILQGLSVGGQLMSSLVFTLEAQPPSKWGQYGSLVLAATNIGTLMGSMIGAFLRLLLTDVQLRRFGWRIPFLSGILIVFVGFYLRYYCQEHDEETTKTTKTTITTDETTTTTATNKKKKKKKNPIRLAFQRGNRRALLASCLVPMISSASFYVTFVWLPVYMSRLISRPLERDAFWINCFSLLVSVILTFPAIGRYSDRTGRPPIMTVGMVSVAILAPVLIYIVGLGNSILAFVAQSCLGITIAIVSAPTMAWLVEIFPQRMRLTSTAIGYNVAQGLMGGFSPSIATYLVSRGGGAVGNFAPGLFLSGVALISLIGLRCIAPKLPITDFDDYDDESLHLTEERQRQNIATGKDIA